VKETLLTRFLQRVHDSIDPPMGLETIESVLAPHVQELEREIEALKAENEKARALIRQLRGLVWRVKKGRA
jgi:uncharacterized protein YaaW (UPF0174 family)